MAVRHIVRAQNHPIPYILHGPPDNSVINLSYSHFSNLLIIYVIGTGKTKTLVAAIAEIINTTNEHVLVTAHSNTACDELTTRLLDVLPNEVLYRLYAKSFKKTTVNTKVLCNLQKDDFEYPSFKFLYQFRVVVSTLMTVANLVRARDSDGDFDSSHFSRVFIDEAGCIHEPGSMIPIAGLFSHFLCDKFLSKSEFLFHSV